MTGQTRIYQPLNQVFLILLLSLMFSNHIQASKGIQKDRFAYMDSLLIVSKSNDSQIQAEEYYSITLYFFQIDSLFSANDYAKKGILAAEKEENYNVLGNLYIIQGYIYLNYGTYVKSIDFFSKGEQIGKKHQLDKVVMGANHGMGRVYNELGEYDKALEVLSNGLSIAKNDSVAKEIVVFYNAIGVALQSQEKFDSALVYFKKYYQKSTERSDTLSMIYALVNIGECFRLSNDFDTAIEYYYQATELNKSINNAQAKAAIYGNLSSIYTSRKNYELAIQYLKKGIAVCSSNDGLSSYLLQDYKLVVDNYAAISQYDSAYVYYIKYIAFRDSVYEKDRIRTIDNLLSGYEIAEKEAQAKILAQKLRNRTLVLVFSISLSVLIVLLLILTYSRYKLKTRFYKKETKALNLTIDEKNRELVTRVMDQNHQNEVYEDINTTLAKLEKTEDIESLKQYLTSLKQSLSKKEKVGMGWDSFKLHFEQVHTDFFEELLNKSESLTQNDLRICAYIKLNLSTKDIANILNISDRAIQTSRYRIKKKLNLPPEVDLIKFIQSI